MEELWKRVVGFEDAYEVSSLGRIRSIDRVTASWASVKGRVLVLVKDTLTGYLYAHPRYYGQRLNLYVSETVLTAFVGPRPTRQVARHLNDDRLDNRLENLSWGTRSENSKDIVRNGNNRESLKTHCPQGHPLVAPNLSNEKMLLGHRKCRACTNGRAYAQRRNIPFKVEYADAALERLLKVDQNVRA